MQELINKRRNKKGFTLAELLIVVAIIAVLVAIAIPIFTSQLEKSREATDKANIRSAYAEASAALLDGSSFTAKKVDAKQTQAKWQSEDDADKVNVGGIEVSAKTDGSQWTISVDTTNNKVTIE